MNSRATKKYRIANKHRFAELYNFAMQYPEWKKQLEEVSVIKSPDFDGLPRSGRPGNPTETIGIQAADLVSKVQLVELCARESDPDIWKTVLYAVTHTNITYKWLSDNRRLYCGRDKYYLARSKFYWLLDKRKDE